MSEDPIAFAVWVRVRPGHSEDALAALRDTRPHEERMALLRDVQRAVADERHVLVHPAVGWSLACQVRLTPPDWCADVVLVQCGYGPDSALEHCEAHALRYGGCLGCHVCRGFYRP